MKGTTVFVVAILVLATGSPSLGADDPKDTTGSPGTVHAVLGADGKLKFIFVPDSSDQGYLTGDYAGLIDPFAFPTDKATSFKITSDRGKFAGYWIGADTPEGAFALTNAVPLGWGVEKVASIDVRNVGQAYKGFPVIEKQVMESLGRELLARAKELACKSSIRPKEIAVTASLEASVGFIVGGAGTISFQATWDSEQLCK